ncbi:MAG: diguanylate cyclase/phosphodiesterase (GGDEF & EAL domains) with PAS/PAC sensor(s) [uncultured Propionibacteriaceae bacterium]|uniref:Diguanylate cyclase/phosphodiesterase (GGDEF & EAL domains) with PAS/PAC sensor(S) n=1 Tax=uncultured Propionibacteriaceae bacterium TaxID=257457 RepID=A0A6J4N6J7_9ACTN|nr:MAG: diguanylate cyclase/phosphodiesterase (GGDEF & EAL domains) with PAS/PAC sensor(s) [uncultured Propionibacteriaceae bacterium]
MTTVNGSNANAAIVKSAIDLGHNLGLHVVAEGVETHACLEVLTDMGCDVMQGYLLARPMPAGDLSGWSAGRTGEQDGRRGVARPIVAPC